AQYGLLCREDGGILDDVFTYRLAECEFLTVTNAANHDKDLAWMTSHAEEFDVDVIDVASQFAMLAVQGHVREGWSAPWRTARCSRAAPSPQASAHATRSGSRSAFTSTATTWTRRGIRSRQGSDGRARSRRVSSAPKRWPRRARTAPPSGWSRS